MIALLAIVAVLLLPGAAYAQHTARALEIDDFGFTRQISPGARAAGMAGAYTALVNDGNGLIYNPAGLASVKRIEISLGAYHSRDELETGFYGGRSSIDATGGSLELASVTFPVPVLRGSLVGAAGVYRVYSSVLDLHYSGLNLMTNTTDNFLVQQTGSVYAYNVGFGVDLASVLSGGASGFLLDGSINSLRQYDYTFLSALRSIFVSDDVSMDVSGYGGRVGAMFHVYRGIKAGIAFTTPVVVRARGNAVTEVTEHVDNGIDTFLQSTAPVETEYLLPARFDLGVAATWTWVTLSLDAGYSDWTSAAIERRRLRNQNLETLFREILELRVGTEITLPWFPVKLRGGYAQLPYPLKFLPADRIELQELQKVSVDTERHQWAFGLGALVARVLLLDAAYTRTSGERSVENYSQREEAHRFVLTASYRF